MSKGNGNDRDRPRGEDAFVERAAALFDDSVQALDGETRSRLNRGRQRALEVAAAPRPAILARAWLPAGGVAAAGAVAVAMLVWNRPDLPGPQAAPPAAIADDFELLLDGDSLEMLEELEFYSWLDGADGADGDDGSEHVG